MSKYGQRKSIGRQEASSDSKGSVLSFSPRVHVLKTQTCIPRYGSSSFATSAGHLCCEQLKLQVLMCPEENQKHGDRNHLGKVSPNPSCFPCFPSPWHRTIHNSSKQGLSMPVEWHGLSCTPGLARSQQTFPVGHPEIQ